MSKQETGLALSSRNMRRFIDASALRRSARERLTTHPNISLGEKLSLAGEIIVSGVIEVETKIWHGIPLK